MKRKNLLGLVTIILCFSMVGMPNPGKAILAAPNQPANVCGTDTSQMGCWLFDEGTGHTTTADGSGHGNTGTLQNSPTWVASKNANFGTALQYLRSTPQQYVQVPTSISIDIHGAITLAAWVKPTATQTQHLIQKGVSTGGINNGEWTDGYELSLGQGGKAFFRLNYKADQAAAPGDTWRVDTQTSYPINGTWIFIVGTYDPDVADNPMHIYYNGVLDDDTFTPGPDSIGTMATDLYFARDPGTGSNYSYSGVMDDVRIYNRALSAAEILIMYNDPTAVNLVDFRAMSRPLAIQLGWQTAQETDLLGFNLYRAEALDGPQGKINTQLIPAINPGQFQGNAYQYLDATAGAGKTYYYWVEWVGNSSSQLYGPVTANIAPYWLWLPIGLK